VDIVDDLVLVLDVGGTFVFAISGALAGARRRLDVFGILVLAFVTGNLGSITRDLLIGSVPPAALSDNKYLFVSILAGLVTFFWYPAVDKLRMHVLLFDAVGLAFFAIAGTQKALSFGLSPVMSALLGMLTGIGGGMMRDVLVNEIPQVLRADLYAVAALAATTVVVVGHMVGLNYGLSALLGGLACFGLRYMAIRHGWRLPSPASRRERAEGDRPDDEKQG